MSLSKECKPICRGVSILLIVATDQVFRNMGVHISLIRVRKQDNRPYNNRGTSLVSTRLDLLRTSCFSLFQTANISWLDEYGTKESFELP